jgi:nitrate reductase gamma subunit
MRNNNMNFFSALVSVIILLLIPTVGVGVLNGHLVFGVVIPYVAFAVFVIGFVYRVLKWAGAPVPFHIPTVGGQQKSLPWIKADKIESPYTTAGVVGRLALDLLLFRPLFWNERVELPRAHQLIYKRNLYLWIGGLAFHWSLLTILVRHLRFFTEPVPGFVLLVQWLDEILQNLLPLLYMTDVVILIALGYLVIRRLVYPQIRHISLFSDYFAVLLLLGVALTGVLMRLIFKVDLVAVKGLVVQMLGLHPVRSEGIGLLFYIHLFLICVLAAYFPFSKLMHLAGALLSPTRNLKNNSRMERHVNPWNGPVKVHTYEEYEDEFRTAMKEVGLPLEKE